MMEQRNQMLRELRLNKKESLGVVSVPNRIFFILIISFYLLNSSLLFFLIKSGLFRDVPSENFYNTF
jgi:hypothetical protein